MEPSQPESPQPPASSVSPEPSSSEQAERAARAAQIVEKLKREQNLPRGIVLGLVAALIGSVVWAAITVNTGYQIGWLAVGVGFIVGYAVRLGGRGLNPTFGYAGAILAFFGCALGNYLSIVGIVAEGEGVSYLEVITAVGVSAIPGLMVATFQAMDLLFYGIAVYEGYKFSFRQLTAAELGLPVPADETEVAPPVQEKS